MVNMKKIRDGVLSAEGLFLLIVIMIIAILAWLPTGFPTNAYPDSTRAAARVLEVNNDGIFSAGGIILQGDQRCQIQILSGPFKGEGAMAINRFTGRLEFDKVFVPGDKALVVIDFTDNTIRHVNIIDHYRLDLELYLFLAFALFLIVFARWVGVKAILSFVLTVMIIWKVLVPLLLKGFHPILVSLGVVTFLTLVVISLVGGLNRKSLAAILGSFSGTLLTCILAMGFGKLFKIHGAILPFSETLLYAGYHNLNLTDIFIAVVFIASAGALMDLAMDIAAAVYEIVQQNPGISTREAINSGFNIGRAVVGTMTTTLLFAYTGGYMAMLMYFMAQGTPLVNILNLRYVSAEILHTLVGSFGLVAVAPLTAILSGFLFTRY